MEVADLASARTRVAMVWPDDARVTAGVADMRATPDDASELVDQLHWGEIVRVLASRGDHRFVQAEDHYFGWVRADSLATVQRGQPIWAETRVVAVALAAVYEDRDRSSALLGEIPAGTWLWRGATQRHEDHAARLAPWESVSIGDRRGFVARDDTMAVRDIPQRPPTADDLIRTAEAFLGSPYLWGGTTAHGLDCSGYVQQVYRLNGIQLDRDADQQATEGRSVEAPAPGDLLFFGSDRRITHVALATGERTFLHAPQSGGAVEHSQLSPERTLRAIRRYLPDPA